MPHTFPRDERARLNNEERKRDQPAEGMIERMDPRPQERCIDLGCGTGYVSIPLAKKVKCVIGLDSEDMMLKDLLKNAEIAGVANIRTINSRLPAIDAPSRSFDRAVLVNVLHEVEDKDKLSSEISRVLKIGGHLSLVDFQKNTSSFGPPVEERIDEVCVLPLFPGFEKMKSWTFQDFYQFELIMRGEK